MQTERNNFILFPLCCYLHRTDKQFQFWRKSFCRIEQFSVVVFSSISSEKWRPSCDQIKLAKSSVASFSHFSLKIKPFLFLCTALDVSSTRILLVNNTRARERSKCWFKKLPTSFDICISTSFILEKWSFDSHAIYHSHDSQKESVDETIGFLCIR